MTVAEAGWPLHMRCLPAGRECGELAAMLVALAAKVTLLQRPQMLQMSGLEQMKSQARAVAQPYGDAATLEGGSRFDDDKAAAAMCCQLTGAHCHADTR